VHTLLYPVRCALRAAVRLLQRACGTEGLSRRQEEQFVALQDAIASVSTAVASLCLDRDSVMASGLYTDALERLRLLSACDIQSSTLVRVGGPNDGGYVMVDDIYSSTTPVAYSIGINRDVTWDVDVARRGVDVFMYDHTISALPTSHPRFHFRRQGLTGTASRADMRTLEQMVQDNGHCDVPRMLLKIDVEGAEWDALLHTPSDLLARFSQIVIEFHGLIPTTHDSDANMVSLVLEKLLVTHRPVHVHGNTYGPSLILPGIVLPWGAEVTYASRAVYGERFVTSSRYFPTHVDASNRRDRCDMILGDLGRSICDAVKPHRDSLSEPRS
jgi:hypothetical protein